MDSGWINEMTLGLAAGICVLLSYLFTDQLKLRIINLIGSFLFACYGVVIIVITNLSSGWTTVGLNIICFIVHLVWVIRYKKGRICLEKTMLKKRDKEKEDV